MTTNADNTLFDEWLEETGRGMTLVTAGQSGVGKSTLVANLLRLADNDADAPIAEQSPDSVTKFVKAFSANVKGVEITIVDMPGLAAASDDEEKKAIAELTKVTKGRADMLLYCANMGPSGKLNKLDHKIVQLLTSVFEPKVWERAILVLTFANVVKERNQKHGTTAKTPTVEAAMGNYAEAFRKMLANINVQLRVIPVLRDEGAQLRPAKDLAAVVGGEMPNEEILPGINWSTCLYGEVLKKCERDAIPLILTIVLLPVPDYVQSEGKQGAYRGSIVGGIGGAIAGAAAVAAAGVGVGFLAGGIGAIPGAIGGAVGGAVGGVGGGVGGRVAGGIVGHDVYYKLAYERYLETDEGKRAQLLKEIEALRMEDEATNVAVQENKKDK